MKRKILNSAVLAGCCALVAGCVSFETRIITNPSDPTAPVYEIGGTSFMRPLAEVQATIPRNDDEGNIEAKIIYAKDQVTVSDIATVLPGGGQ